MVQNDQQKRYGIVFRNLNFSNFSKSLLKIKFISRLNLIQAAQVNIDFYEKSLWNLFNESL